MDYTPATSLWLLTFLSIEMARNRMMDMGLGFCLLHVSTLIGSFPVPDTPSTWADFAGQAIPQVAASSLLVTLLILPLNLWCSMRTGRG